MNINWDEVLLRARKENHHTYGLLSSCRQREVDGETVTLRFASDVLRNEMQKEKNITIVEKVLMALYDINFTIRCVNGDGEEARDIPDFDDWDPPNVDIEKNTREFEVAFAGLKKDQRRQEYEDYLKSDRWKTLRQHILDFWGNRCILCNSPYDLHVHHRTYERFGFEIFPDLIPLCKDCHQKHHDMIPEYY